MLDSVGVHMDLESAAADCRCRAEISSEEKLYDGDEEGKHIFHVLAVDDSPIDRKLLERLLTVSSYQVTCVDSGDKALEYLGLLRNVREDEIKISPPLSPPISCDIDEPSSKSPSPREIISTISCHQPSSKPSSPQQVSKVNLIMTDYSMPGISGYDLLKRIKDSSWKDVPVVVMSSENVPSRINMCLEGGAEEFLLKPVKPSDLSKLQSHILKNAIGHNPNCLDRPKTTIEEHLTIGNDEKGTTNDGDVENDKNCSNAYKRKATLKTPPDLTDRRPRVQELSVS